MSRKSLIIIGAVIVLIPIALVVALKAIPDSVYRSQITAAAKGATGRDLTIGGAIGISIFPVLGVHAEDVKLANAPGFTAPALASMKRLEAGVALMPLLSGKVEIKRFVLVEPVIALEVDANGKNNWTLEPAAQKPEEQSSESSGGAPSEVSIENVAISDGRASYADHKSGETTEIGDIDLAVALPSLDKEGRVDGSLNYKGQPLTIAFAAENPRALMDGSDSPAKLEINADLLKLSFEGTAALKDDLALKGKTDLSTPSLRKLSAWLSEPMSEGQGFGAFAVKGDFAWSGDIMALQNAAISLDETKATGALTVNMGGERPRLTGTLALDQLNAGTYLGGAPAPAAGTSSGAAAPQSDAPAAAPASTPSSEWSTEPLDFSGLKSADADLQLTAQKVIYDKVVMSNAVLGLLLNNGVMTADLSRMALYNGAGKLKIVLNGASATPALNIDLAFTSIAVQPLLKDFADFDRLSGTGNLSLSATSSGKNERAMMQNLNGSGALKVLDGAIRGINLAAMVRNVTSAFTGANSGEQKTDFAELGGTYKITSGILSNDDLALINPYLRLSGMGVTSIPERTVNYRITPKLVANAEGQGGKTDLTGVSVPVLVTGTWDNLKYAPDLKALASGALKGVTEALQSGQDPLKGALDGLLGKPGAKPQSQDGGTEQEAPPPKSTEDQARDALKSIFKKNN